MNEVTTTGPEANIGGVQVSLQSVYLKDSSYESPNGPRLPNNQGWEPKFQLNMNTSTEELAADVREVLLTITLEAKQGEATLYLVEVKQAGVFSISGASVEDLKRLIGSFCPSVLFPYAREVVSDLIVKGGFPNFLLPLVNFEALFAQASESPPQQGLVNYGSSEGYAAPARRTDDGCRRRFLGHGARHTTRARRPSHPAVGTGRCADRRDAGSAAQ